VADLTPIKGKIAKCVRRLGSATPRGDRVAAFLGLGNMLENAGADWNDFGDLVENSYSEEEMHQIVDAVRKEERQRAQQSAAQSNGHFALPSPAEMADFCEARRNWLKDDAQRRFIEEMVLKTHNQVRLQRGTLGYLALIYIKHGGKI
jgi:hypothetical protein